MNNRRSKQRIPLFLAGLFPIVSGMLWGGFWLNGIAGMEHFASGFALLALAGDLGCGSGPTIVGAVAERFGDDLKVGVLSAIVFPILLVVVNVLLKKKSN